MAVRVPMTEDWVQPTKPWLVDSMGLKGFRTRYLPVTSSFPPSLPSLPNSVHQPRHHPPQAPHPMKGRSCPPGGIASP